MPFDQTQKVLFGDDAKTPEAWARQVFCAWLAGRLNDPSGPYAEALGVSEQRQAYVLENPEIARAMYRDAEAPPVVSIMQGPVVDYPCWRTIDDVDYVGRRIEMECSLGMGVRDRTAEDDDLAAERSDDNNLAGFVCDAIQEGLNELDQLGLFKVSIQPDPEAGVKHPQKLTFFIRTLRDWIPSP